MINKKKTQRRNLVSTLMFTILLTQIMSPTIIGASELNSEIQSEIQSEEKNDVTSEKTSKIQSEEQSEEQSNEKENESIKQNKILQNEKNKSPTKKQEKTKSSKALTDFSGIGNQNLSGIGQGTFLSPNEETEDSLKTISDLELTNNLKYKSVTDLNTPLIEAATEGETLSESIMFNEYKGMTTSEINQSLAASTTWNGTCWEDQTSTSKSIITKITPSDECNVFVEDIGYYYNLNNMEYTPIDLNLEIDYLDFFNSPLEQADAKLIIKIDSNGISFQTSRTNEIQYTLTITKKDGTVVNVPTFYELKDIDGGSGLGMSKDDVYKIVTYYQDEIISPSSGDYGIPEWTGSLYYTNEPVFNYLSFYEYVVENYNNGLVTDAAFISGTSVRDNDRSIYNTIDPTINGNGTYTAEDRGWNRLKFYETSDYISFYDTWGPNSNGISSTSEAVKYNSLVTNGKDSDIVIMVNSSTTMTTNLINEFLGFAPDERGAGQTWILQPYSFVGDTIIKKSIKDENSNNIAERGEDLTYDISVTNISTETNLSNIPVRDSLLEDLPDYLSWDGTVKVTDLTNGTTIPYSGDLSKGTFQLDDIPAMTEVQIEYVLNVTYLPNTITEIINVATDNGEDPKDLCDSTTGTIDCSGTEIPVEEIDPIIDPTQGETVIEKSITEESGDGLIQGGEKITYKLEISNNGKVSANGVEIRDSMLENIPTWLSLNDITISPNDITYKGNLEDGNLIINTIEPGQKVIITYDVTAAMPLPNNIETLNNVATDDGSNPIDPDTNLPIICSSTSEDCAETITPLDPQEPIIDPTQGETTIEKSITEESGDGLIQGGEKVTYQINIINDGKVDANNVIVRDSMLENMPEWLTYNNDVTITPESKLYSGSLENGDLTFNTIKAGEVVTITYSVTAPMPLPNNIDEVLNLATDNGDDPTTIDPDTCTSPSILGYRIGGSDDCSSTITPLDPQEPIIDPTQAETVIKKSVKEESGEGLVQGGEILTYTIEVTNKEKIDAHNVIVRDNLIENLPTWLTIEEDVQIQPTDITHSGNLEDGNLTFNTIKPGETVTITYSLKASQPLPNDTINVINIATDNGQDPNTLIPGTCNGIELGPITIGSSDDCSSTITPLDPQEPIIDPTQGQTKIEKSITEESGDGLVQSGEKLVYEITLTNNGKYSANNVPVRDSMLENMPDWLTYNNDLTITPSDKLYSGNLEEGTFRFNQIQPGEEVTITYSVTAAHPMPDDIEEILNVVTDNGDDPTTINPDICNGINLGPINIGGSEDCANTITPIDPPKVIIDPTQGNTNIKKIITSNNTDNLKTNDIIEYTIEVNNPTQYDAHNVPVRDSLIESPNGIVSYNNDLKITGSDFKGNIEDGTLILNNVKAGETVTLEYSMTIITTDSTITTINNIATDNGDNPNKMCDEQYIDCDESSVNIKIEKPTDETNSESPSEEAISEEVIEEVSETPKEEVNEEKSEEQEEKYNNLAKTGQSTIIQLIILMILLSFGLIFKLKKIK